MGDRIGAKVSKSYEEIFKKLQGNGLFKRLTDRGRIHKT